MTDKFNPRDPAQLDALMELANGATPGPWYHGFEDGSGLCGQYGGGCIISNQDDPETVVMGGCDEIDYGVEKSADANFIAASREAVPALIEEVKRLREDKMKLAHAIDDLTNCGAETDFKIVARYVGAICKNGEAITLAREALKAEGV